MGKRTETTLTYKVKVKAPTGKNAHQVQLLLREAILALPSDNVGNDTMFAAQDFTVSLLKKETTYA